MSYTLATAAAATGLNKSAILWAIKLGKVSAAKDQHGEWQIEPVELHRIYPPVAPQRYAPPHAAAIVEAHQQVTMLQAVLDVMKADRDGWRDQAQRLLLADQSAPIRRAVLKKIKDLVKDLRTQLKPKSGRDNAGITNQRMLSACLRPLRPSVPPAAHKLGILLARMLPRPTSRNAAVTAVTADATEDLENMNRPGRKYFRGRRIHGDRVIHFAVWDGVLNYQNAPPLRAIALAEKMPGTPLHVKVDAAAVEDLRQIIEAPLRTCPEVGGLVVWAQDHQTYRRIVQQADRGRKHLADVKNGASG